MYTAAMTALSVMSDPRPKGAGMVAGQASPSTGSRKPDTPCEVAVSMGSPGSAARCSTVSAAQRAAMAAKMGPRGCVLCTYITSIRWLFLWAQRTDSKSKGADNKSTRCSAAAAVIMRSQQKSLGQKGTHY